MTGKIVVATPVGGSFTVPYHRSVVGLLKYELGKPAESRLLFDIYDETGCFVQFNRDEIVRRFLGQPNPEWLLMIDSDIEFMPTLLEQMLERAGKAKIVAASVPLGNGRSICHLAVEPGKWRRMAMDELPKERLFAWPWVATAVIMIHREVLDHVCARFGVGRAFEVQYDEKYPGMNFWAPVGEDFAFCRKAISLGYQPHVARDFHMLRHHKTNPLQDEWRME